MKFSPHSALCFTWSLLTVWSSSLTVLVQGCTCQWESSIFGPLAVGKCRFESFFGEASSFIESCEQTDKSGNPLKIEFPGNSECAREGPTPAEPTEDDYGFGDCSNTDSDCAWVELIIEGFFSAECEGDPYVSQTFFITTGGSMQCGQAFGNYYSYQVELNPLQVTVKKHDDSKCLGEPSDETVYTSGCQDGSLFKLKVIECDENSFEPTEEPTQNPAFSV